MLESRLFLLGAAVLWSTAGAAMKSCGLSGFQIACGRSLVAAVFLFASVSAARRLPTRASLLTSLAYALTVGLFAISNKLTTAANAIFLQSTAPLWVLLFSRRWLGEVPTRAELLSIPVYGVGLALFFFDELSPAELGGNLVALASGLAFACCIVGLRRIPGQGASALVLGNLLTALLTSPLWFDGPTPRATDLGIVVYLGVFQLGLSYLCFVRGVAHVAALEASLLVLLEPVLNPIWTFLFTGERPGPWALAGGSIVLAATVWRILAPYLLAGRPIMSAANERTPEGTVDR